MNKVQYHGAFFDERTYLMLKELEKRLGWHVTITQGSYSGGVSASAGTHNGGGAADIQTRGLTGKQKLDLVREARTVGFAAWLRPKIAGLWNEHCHAIAVGCPDASAAAKRQVQELRDGGDGLKGGAPDPHRDMHLPVVSWEEYLDSQKPKPARPPLVVQKVNDKHKPGSRELRKGDKGTDVAFVQGFVDSRLAQDGDFGPVTEKAVKAYQKMRGIKQTGVVDAKTWEQML